MKDIIVSVSRETRMVNVTKNFLGNDGENLQGNIVFQFVDGFVNGVARLEYILESEEKYIMLAKEEDKYIVPIKSVLTKEGHINMQLVITENDELERMPIFKSNIFFVYCNKSINAEIEQPDEYPTWIEIANAKINEIDNAIREVEELKDYDILSHKPRINNVELTGDKTLEDLGYIPYDDSELKQDINNLDIEVDNLTNNTNLMASDINTHTNEINALETQTNRLESELKEQEENINYISDTTYTKNEVDDKVKGFATTSSLIAGINGCEPKMADSVDYVIETGVYGEGESGYRKYKNGFIEQWGVATTNANETEFRMHKPHINQNYSVFIEPREIGNFYHYATPSTNQNFKCRIQSRDSVSMAVKFQWHSFGRWK